MTCTKTLPICAIPPLIKPVSAEYETVSSCSVAIGSRYTSRHGMQSSHVCTPLCSHLQRGNEGVLVQLRPIVESARQLPEELEEKRQQCALRRGQAWAAA